MVTFFSSSSRTSIMQKSLTSCFLVIAIASLLVPALPQGPGGPDVSSSLGPLPSQTLSTIIPEETLPTVPVPTIISTVTDDIPIETEETTTDAVPVSSVTSVRPAITTQPTFVQNPVLTQAPAVPSSFFITPTTTSTASVQGIHSYAMREFPNGLIYGLVFGGFFILLIVGAGTYSWMVREKK